MGLRAWRRRNHGVTAKTGRCIGFVAVIGMVRVIAKFWPVIGYVAVTGPGFILASLGRVTAGIAATGFGFMLAELWQCIVFVADTGEDGMLAGGFLPVAPGPLFPSPRLPVLYVRAVWGVPANQKPTTVHQRAGIELSPEEPLQLFVSRGLSQKRRCRGRSHE